MPREQLKSVGQTCTVVQEVGSSQGKARKWEQEGRLGVLEPVTVHRRHIGEWRLDHLQMTLGM